MRTALYRLYAADGTLLYIGVTGNLLARFRDHRYKKAWWPQVAGMRLDYYGSHAEAEEAESAAVRSESPVHNVFYTPAHGEAVRAGQQRVVDVRLGQARDLLSGDPLLFGSEPEWVRAQYRRLIEDRLQQAG